MPGGTTTNCAVTSLRAEPGDQAALRTLHVIAGLSPSDGGPSYSVPRLCAALAARDAAEVTLLTVARPAETPDVCSEAGVCRRSFAQDFARVPILGSLRLSAGLDHAIGGAASGAEVVHNHGLWLAPNVRAGWAAAKARRPLIISPRGMLSPVALSFSRRRKQVFWRLAQRAVVRGAACLHATSIAEYYDIRGLGLTNPVAVIANGVDVAGSHRRPASVAEIRRTVLTLGRIHPKKGLERLLRAWTEVETAHPDWRLRIIGPAEDGHDAELRRLAASLGLRRVTVEGPVYGDDKLTALEAADLFVLPTLNENFGLTVAESLACGRPVICTAGAPWSGLRTHDCGWWIDHGVEPLANALDDAMSMPRTALSAMGEKGRSWMARDFSWERIADDMLATYRWLARGAEPPRFVRFD